MFLFRKYNNKYFQSRVEYEYDMDFMIMLENQFNDSIDIDTDEKISGNNALTLLKEPEPVLIIHVGPPKVSKALFSESATKL